MNWSQLELELVTAVEAVGPIAMPSGQDKSCPQPAASDPIATQMRQRAAYATARERQGIVHRGALASLDLVAATTALRARAQADDAPAVLTLVALVIGISPSLAPALPLHSAAGCAAALNPQRGWITLDMARILLAGAAAAAANETALPATHDLRRPLPAFLAQIIRRAHRRNRHAQRLGDLFGLVVPDPNEPLDDRKNGRLRTTTARVLSALPAFALRVGIDPYEAALLTGQWSLVPRSRFFYIRSDTHRLDASHRTYYNDLGWGDPEALEVVLPFGSKAVPALTSVQRVHRELRERIEAVRPARRYCAERLIEYHNCFACAAAWYLSFVTGSREMRRLDFMADRCVPAISVMEYADKLSAPFRRMLPLLFGRQAQAQVAAIWVHLVHLWARAHKLGLDERTPWLRHLRAVLENRPVPLLFAIRRGRAVGIGTAHTQIGLDRTLRLAPNAGRHFWQTALHQRGVGSEALNLWARQGSAGIEPATSTTFVAIDLVRAQVCAGQDEMLAELGTFAFSGLGPRSQP